MKKLILTLTFIFAFSISVFAEDVTITTYYPAPSGVYKELRAETVGIGTTNPLTPFEVASTTDGILIPRMTMDERDHILLPIPNSLLVYVEDTPHDDDGYYYYDAYSSPPGWVQLVSSGGSGGWWDTDNDIDIYNTNTGNVGIGTMNPNQILHIVEDQSTPGPSLGGIRVENANPDSSGEQTVFLELANVHLSSNKTYRLQTVGNVPSRSGNFEIWDTGNAARLVINPTGNVGIGTQIPNAALQVNGAISRQGTTLVGYNTTSQVNLGINSTTGSTPYYTGCTVSGGESNTASGGYGVVSGGQSNIASGGYGVASGGQSNTASGYMCVISGGSNNVATSTSSTGWNTVAGGKSNTASGFYSTVSGGLNNVANGLECTVAGGASNEATGQFSFAAGYHSKANHNGCFVWADSQSGYYSSSAANQFRVRALGGAFLNSGAWSDIAEFMDVLKNEKVEEGELVSIKMNDRLGKSSKPYDEKLIGVISSKKTCTLNLGQETPLYDDTEKLRVAMVGRVFIKVNNEAGAIKLGDPVTSSSQPGIGMKALKSGKIVGYAMQEENFKNKDISEVLVFVSLGYYQNPEEYSELVKEVKLLKEALKTKR